MYMSPISKTKGFVLQNMSETFPNVLSKQKRKVYSPGRKLMSHSESVWNASSMAGICHHIETKTVALKSVLELHYVLFDLREWLGPNEVSGGYSLIQRWNPSRTEICGINLIHFNRARNLCQVFNITTYLFHFSEDLENLCAYTLDSVCWRRQLYAPVIAKSCLVKKVFAKTKGKSHHVSTIVVFADGKALLLWISNSCLNVKEQFSITSVYI